MADQNNQISYGYPLEVNFSNTSDYNSDIYSGERKRVYGVITTFTTPKYTQKIQYEVTVNYLEKQLENNFWIVELNKSKVYVNQESTDRILDKINEEFMLQVLYPIEIWVSSTGKLLGIHKFGEVTKRFKKFIHIKRKEYSGIHAEHFFNLLEQKMLSSQTLLTSLKKDWFFTTFFTPIYYPSGFMGTKTMKTLSPPFFSTSDGVYYESELQSPQDFVRNNTIAMQYKAENTDEQTNLSIDYELNTTSFLINEIHSKSELKEGDEIIKTITTSIIHLSEQDKKPILKKKKKRGFFW